jgi:Na+-driven multidrug efflux pump
MSKKWTIISIISRFSAVAIGMVQSIIIAKLLTVDSYGLLNIVMGIGASLGVYQNLGISSGSTREIAGAKDKDEAFKIFITSLAIRYIISIPLALGLFFFAKQIASSMNGREEIIFPLQLFAITMVIQSLQSVLNSVIQGFKKFKFLFVFQILIAFVSLAIYLPLIFKFEFLGYFYALVLFNLLSTLVLAAYSYKLFLGGMNFPTKKEFKEIFRSIFKIGIFIYLMKIIDTQWHKLQPFLLGFVVSDYKIGLFSFALLISSKISTVSDAITDVSLPSMTSVYEKSQETFKKTYLNGSLFASVIILFSVVALILFKYEIFLIVDYLFSFLGKESLTSKYGGAFAFIDPLAIAFWGYSQLNLVRSGFSVPAKKLMGSFVSYLALFGLTYLFYSTLNFIPDVVLKLSVSMAVSSCLSYAILIIFAKREAGFWLITIEEILLILISALVIFSNYLDVSNYLLIFIYSLFVFWIYKTHDKNS